MAISNYGELKQKLSRYLFNQRFLADYDDYTTIFEADANSRLRVLPMETIVTIQTATGSVDLPSDYLLWRTVLYVPGEDVTSTTEYEIDYVHPAYLNDGRVQNNVQPVFTIEGSEFKTSYIPVDPAIGIYRFHYYQKIPTLVGADANSNWLLTEYPNAYLFGLMVEAAGQGRNAEMAQLYKARRDEVLAEIVQRYALTTSATSPSVRTAEYF